MFTFTAEVFTVARSSKTISLPDRKVYVTVYAETFEKALEKFADLLPEPPEYLEWRVNVIKVEEILSSVFVP